MTQEAYDSNNGKNNNNKIHYYLCILPDSDINDKKKLSSKYLLLSVKFREEENKVLAISLQQFMDEAIAYAWLSLYVKSLPENYPGLENLLHDFRSSQGEAALANELAQPHHEKHENSLQTLAEYKQNDKENQNRIVFNPIQCLHWLFPLGERKSKLSCELPCKQRKLDWTVKSRNNRVKFDFMNGIVSGGGGYFCNEIVFEGIERIHYWYGIADIPVAGNYIISAMFLIYGIALLRYGYLGLKRSSIGIIKAYDEINEIEEKLNELNKALTLAESSENNAESAKNNNDIEYLKCTIRYYKKVKGRKQLDIIKHILRALVYAFSVGIGLVSIVNSLSNIIGASLLGGFAQSMLFLVEEASIYTIEFVVGLIKYFWYGKDEVTLATECKELAEKCSLQYKLEAQTEVDYSLERLTKRKAKLWELSLAYIGVACFVIGDLVKYIQSASYWIIKGLEGLGLITTTCIVWADFWYYKHNKKNQAVKKELQEDVALLSSRVNEISAENNEKNKKEKEILKLLVKSTKKLSALNVREAVMPAMYINDIEKNSKVGLEEMLGKSQLKKIPEGIDPNKFLNVEINGPHVPEGTQKQAANHQVLCNGFNKH